MLLINKSAVIFEVMGNEVVIVNLKKGAYYSLGGAGVVIWNLLEKEATSQEIVEAVALSYMRERVLKVLLRRCLRR